MRVATRAARAVVGMVGLALLTACGTGGPDADGRSGVDSAAAAGGDDELSGDLTVFAAASLTETFTELADRMMAEHPGVEVTVGLGGSSGLAAQVVAGAPADVFASASPLTMQTVVDAGDAAEPPRVFARNRLRIAVPPDNPAGVTGLADLADPGLTIALCAPEVPCGAASVDLFAAHTLAPAPDTLERDVRAVLTKVRLGEVDAGLVYATDVVAAGRDVLGLDVAGASAVNDYEIAVLTEAPNPRAARTFVRLVLSAEGRQVLGDAGFDAP